MGKKQHSKDRGYLTTQEWKYEWGGYKDKTRLPFKRLPYHCCAIAFTPFEDPVCTEDGTVYDVTNIVPYVMKYKKHPVTGQPLALKDLIKLNFHKNGEGMYACPITGKVFTEHTHIAAVKTTGNVYAYEALEELNIKPKNWKELITDEPFTRKDIIHIQDPLNLQGRTLEQFDHVQHGLVLDPEPEEAAGSNLRNMSEDMKRALGSLQSAESKAAFEAGGGGKRAEALRLLAAAKNLAAQKKEGKATGTAASNKPDNAASKPATTTGAATDDGGGGDWRLRAPERTIDARFRPGSATWDTEDYTTNAGKALKKKEDAMAKMVVDAGIRGDAGKAALAAVSGNKSTKGMTPQERYEAEGHVKYVESFATTGQAAQSFTSTYAAVHTKTTRQLKRKERNPSKKGYVRLHTNLGDLNIELHCDMVPRTCENFIALCAMGYYKDTIFHRSIKNFMIQGGDPTGTGMGGESIYGKTFPDEVDTRLTHSGRGILSMANSGKDTNGSQFFITFKSCKHLDYKHSVFGRVVGGLEVLTAMERIDTDEDDRPVQEIKVTGATVFTNPYQEMEDAEVAAEAEASKAAALKEAAALRTADAQFGKWYSAPGGAPAQQPAQGGGDAADASDGGGVGKYLKLAATSAAIAGGKPANEVARQPPADGEEPVAKKPRPAPKAASALTNFDAW